jgi:hypothetical protein
MTLPGEIPHCGKPSLFVVLRKGEPALASADGCAGSAMQFSIAAAM